MINRQKKINIILIINKEKKYILAEKNGDESEIKIKLEIDENRY